MRRAFIESRPYLLASLMMAISYYFVRDNDVPGLFLALWKGAGVGLLAAYCLRRMGHDERLLIFAVMAFGAMGDILLEFEIILGAAAFLIGHLLAIWLYSRHRRQRLSPSQRALALLLIPFTLGISWLLLRDDPMLLAVLPYALALSAMAAMAWTSRFSRYRVGTGALLFLLSDLLIFAQMGPLSGSPLPDLLIWPTYYAGQFLIATGVVRALRVEEIRAKL